MTPKTHDKSQYVLVRTTGAGIHVGRFVSRMSTEVTLADVRRIWRWRTLQGATLNEIALYGADETYSRISEPVAENTITGVHEIIPLTEAARANLTRSRWGV